MLNFKRESSAPRGSRRGLANAVCALGAAAIGVASTTRAHAQVQPEGFAVERLYPSTPGAGWIAMDDLKMHGKLGGVAAFSLGYAHRPLRISDGNRTLSLVADQGFFGFGAAVTFERFRISMNLDSPLLARGDSGKVGQYALTGPSVDLGMNPDTVSDARIGLDVRLVGDHDSPLRIGLGAQLIVPSGLRADFMTDGTYRAMGRVLVAGDVGAIAYAGHVGFHVRPLDDSPAPGSPHGHEMLFGLAAGPRIALGHDGTSALVIGPEIFGETAFHAFFGKTTTGVEALLSARLESIAVDGPELHFKVGVGGGLHAAFGAPEWRTVFAVELSDRVR